MTLFCCNEALPLRDKMKNSILLKWLNDPKCNWTNTGSTEVVNEKVEVNTKEKGYGTCYDAAKLMHMDYNVNPTLVDKILEDIPFDDQWDVTNGIQAGYKKAGLKRYKLELIHMTVEEDKDSKKDIMTSTANKKGKLNLTDLAVNSADASVASSNVEVLHPEYVAMQQDTPLLYCHKEEN